MTAPAAGVRGRIASEVGTTLALRLAALALTFGASILTARLLGPALRGELSVMIAIPGLLGAVGVLGADGANLYFGGRSPAAHARIVRYSLVHAVVIGTAITLVALILTRVFPEARLGLDDGTFVLAVALTPSVMAFALLGTAEASRGRAASAALVYLAGTGAWAVSVIFIGWFDAAEPTSLFAAWAAMQLLMAGVMFIIGWTGVRPSADMTWPRYASYALRSNVAGIALLLLLRIDVPIIQLLAGPREVGLYAVVLPMAESLLLVSTAVNLVVLPGVASGIVDRERALVIAGGAVAVASFGAVVIAVAAPLVVPLLFGQAFAPSVGILLIMLPGVVVFTAARAWHVYLLGVGELRTPAVGAVAGLAVCVMLELLLVPRYGALGAALATSVAYAVFAIVQSWGVARITGKAWSAVVVPWPSIRAVRADGDSSPRGRTEDVSR